MDINLKHSDESWSLPQTMVVMMVRLELPGQRECDECMSAVRMRGLQEETIYCKILFSHTGTGSLDMNNVHERK